MQAHRELIYIYGMQLRRAELNAQFLALSRLAPLTSDNVFHWCLLRNNSWEPGEVVATLDRYVSADPADRWSRIALAENYRRMGQTDSADSVLEPLAADDTDALVIRAQIAIDRQEHDRAVRLARLGQDRRRLTGPAPWQDGALETRRSVGHTSIPHRVPGRPRRSRDRFRAGLCALELANDTKAAEPLRELARNLERLNTLVHRAADRTARDDPGLLRELGDACAALHRDPEARAWYELAIARDPLDSASQRALFRLREPSRSTGPAPKPMPEAGSQFFVTLSDRLVFVIARAGSHQGRNDRRETPAPPQERMSSAKRRLGVRATGRVLFAVDCSSTNCSSETARSRADSKRRAGSRAIAFMITVSSSGGKSGSSLPRPLRLGRREVRRQARSRSRARAPGTASRARVPRTT